MIPTQWWLTAFSVCFCPGSTDRSSLMLARQVELAVSADGENWDRACGREVLLGAFVRPKRQHDYHPGALTD
jgi:hypothetical protein